MLDLKAEELRGQYANCITGRFVIYTGH